MSKKDLERLIKAMNDLTTAINSLAASPRVQRIEHVTIPHSPAVPTVYWTGHHQIGGGGGAGGSAWGGTP